MNLDDIQSMWEKDSQIDKDNLHDESLKIPALARKVSRDIHTILYCLRKKAEQQRKILDTNDTNTFLEKQIQMFILRILFQKRFVIKTRCKNTWMLMKS
jgi:hypothetical protein